MLHERPHNVHIHHVIHQTTQHIHHIIQRTYTTLYNFTYAARETTQCTHTPYHTSNNTQHIHHIIHQTTHSTYTVSYIKQHTAHTVKCQGVPDEASVEPASQKQGCQGSGPLALQTLRRTQSSGCLWQTACVRVCVFVRVFVRARVRACIHVRNTLRVFVRARVRACLHMCVTQGQDNELEIWTSKVRG
jgi:hypothetical protein